MGRLGTYATSYIQSIPAETSKEEIEFRVAKVLLYSNVYCGLGLGLGFLGNCYYLAYIGLIRAGE